MYRTESGKATANSSGAIHPKNIIWLIMWIIKKVYFCVDYSIYLPFDSYQIWWYFAVDKFVVQIWCEHENDTANYFYYDIQPDNKRYKISIASNSNFRIDTISRIQYTKGV